MGAALLLDHGRQYHRVNTRQRDKGTDAENNNGANDKKEPLAQLSHLPDSRGSLCN
jgi:hypothetical protein